MARTNDNSELLELLRSLVFKACKIRLSPKRDMFGLTFSQRNALFYLSNYPEIGLTQLSEMLCLTTPSMSKLANSLEQKSYIRRERGAKGKGKKKNIVLTDKGLKIAANLNKEPLKVLTRALEKNTSSEKEQYRKVFKKFLDRLETLDKKRESLSK